MSVDAGDFYFEGYACLIQFLDIIYGHSMRWKELDMTFSTPDHLLARLISLKPRDVPLQSVSIRLSPSTWTVLNMVNRSTLLKIPTLRHLTLEDVDASVLNIGANWNNLVTPRLSASKGQVHGLNVTTVAGILNECTNLVHFSVDLADYRTADDYSGRLIDLPLLKTLTITDAWYYGHFPYSGTDHWLVGYIDAPMLNTLAIYCTPYLPTLITLLKRSTNIHRMTLPYPYFSLTGMAHVLSHCTNLKNLCFKRTNSLERHLGQSESLDLSVCNKFLQLFVHNDPAQRICSQLEQFKFGGPTLDVYVGALRLFLTRKKKRRRRAR